MRRRNLLQFAAAAVARWRGQTDSSKASRDALACFLDYRLLGVQATGNSNAIRAAWQLLRKAGPTARTMLIAAAGKRCASCRSIRPS